MLPYVLQFAATLLLVGLGIRLVETNWPETTVAKALMFMY